MILQQAQRILKYLLVISAAILIPKISLANTFTCQGPVTYFGTKFGGQCGCRYWQWTLDHLHQQYHLGWRHAGNLPSLLRISAQFAAVWRRSAPLF